MTNTVEHVTAIVARPPDHVLGPAVFADGGVIGASRSAIGGMFAWVHIDADNKLVQQAVSLIVPHFTGPAPKIEGVDAIYRWQQDTVTNNQTEFMGLVSALASLPDGWSGNVCSDSGVTIGRLFRQNKLNGIPPEWVKYGGLQLQRLGKLEPVLVKGHPNAEDLRRGWKLRSNGERAPVSRQNVWCDHACENAGKAWMRYLATQRGAR